MGTNQAHNRIREPFIVYVLTCFSSRVQSEHENSHFLVAENF